MSYLNKKIIIIDNSNLSYTGDDIDGTVVRGTEASLILLAEQFIKMGIKVDYCNSINHMKKVNGVNYFNKKDIDKNFTYNLAIAISDANEFDRVSSIKKAVFSNSNQPIEKFIRKNQLIRLHYVTTNLKKDLFLLLFMEKKLFLLLLIPNF